VVDAWATQLADFLKHNVFPDVGLILAMVLGLGLLVRWLRHVLRDVAQMDADEIGSWGPDDFYGGQDEYDEYHGIALGDDEDLCSMCGESAFDDDTPGVGFTAEGDLVCADCWELCLTDGSAGEEL
jgi:hypothetical protein